MAQPLQDGIRLMAFGIIFTRQTAAMHLQWHQTLRSMDIGSTKTERGYNKDAASQNRFYRILWGCLFISAGNKPNAVLAWVFSENCENKYPGVLCRGLVL